MISAIESGEKSKDAIKAEFLQAWPESEGKSTFAVFFSDVVRPLGSASVSRDVQIETAANGLVRFESERAKLLKAAIARGLLSELSAIERNIYPKQDRAAIEQILKRFGIERVSEQQSDASTQPVKR